jgi:hypothetical protein
MAGLDRLDVTFTGVGEHGSSPELTIDPVVMAAQAVCLSDDHQPQCRPCIWRCWKDEIRKAA